MKHNNIKRLVHRSMEELWATWEIARMTSLPKALTTFWAKVNIQIMNRNGFQEPPRVRKRLIRKHETMLQYFENRFGDYYQSYQPQTQLPPVKPERTNKIWICWWQGEENAPELVQRCIQSIRSNAKNHEVVLITEDNFKDYVDMPQWVWDRYKAGSLTRTHLSDLLRLSLLAQHGGMWLDATFFCTDSISLDSYFDVPLWSIKRPDYLHCSIAGGYFATYSLACDEAHRYVFAMVLDFFLEYLAKSDKLVDYLLFDYMIVLAQKYNPKVKEAIAKIQPNNPQCDELLKVLGEAYREDLWQSLTKETGLFKLSWKQAFPLTQDGKETFYSKLLNKAL